MKQCSDSKAEQSSVICARLLVFVSTQAAEFCMSCKPEMYFVYMWKTKKQGVMVANPTGDRSVLMLA